MSSRRGHVVDLLCPERFCPLLDLLDADRAPRFQRPDRPAHAYAQTTRRMSATRLQDNAARSVAPDRAA